MTEEEADKKRREIAQRLIIADRVKKGPVKETNERLRDALKRCIAAESLIPAEQAKLQILIDAAGSDIERHAREYQRELVEKQLKRAAYWANLRLEHLNSLRTPLHWDVENERCKEDSIYWFTWWAWSTDPRPNAPLTEMPVVLFPFQERYINWIERTAFVLRTSGLVEKSRDMGATVCWLDWCVKQWRYNEGFTALLSTVDEDLVDSKKDPDTLFEKVRLQIKFLPEEMLPKGFDLTRDMPYMNIENPENHAVITGDAPTENIGRQRRRTVALFDEFASWRQGGYPQHTAVAQTVPAIFKVSSVKGRLNKYAEERHSGFANVFEMDWRDHPWKDDRWHDALEYGFLGAPMSKAEIAQEIDRNYDASQPGRVFPDYNEVYHVVTWAEFATIVPDSINPANGQYRIPPHWNKGCGLDWGATSEDQHPAVLIWVARAGMNAPRSVQGCVFVYRERMWGNSPTVGDVAREIRSAEDPENEGRGMHRRLSHERSTELTTFSVEHGMGWQKWETGDNWGVAVINEYLKIEMTKAHPFRQIMGRPRVYFLVDDDQGALLDSDTDRPKVVVAKDAAGLKRLRAEMPVFHYPESEKGKPVQAMRPFKFFDDAIAAFRGLAGHFFASAANLTPEEAFEKSLPAHAQYETLQKKLETGALVDYNAFAMNRLIETRAARSRPPTGGALIDRLMSIGGDE